MANLQDNPEVMQAIGLRLEAIRLEQRVKKLKEQSDSILMPLMIAHNQHKIRCAMGSFNYSPAQIVKSVDKTKLKEELINRGIASNIIVEAYQASTRETTKKEYISFRKAKKKS